jgi:cold shock CspA family protein
MELLDAYIFSDGRVNVATERYHGKIVSYNRARGFGFIDRLPGERFPLDKALFFHYSHIEYGRDSPLYALLPDHSMDSDSVEKLISPIEVSFEVRIGEKGYHAFNIRLRKSTSSPIQDLIRLFEIVERDGDSATDRFARSVSESVLKDPVVEAVREGGDELIHLVEDRAKRVSQQDEDSRARTTQTRVEPRTAGQDTTLQQLILARISGSSHTWDDVVTIATQWSKVNTIIRRPLTWSRGDLELLNSVAESLARSLKFQPQSSFDFVRTIPAFVKPLVPLRSPIRYLRETGGISLIMVLNAGDLVQAIEAESIFSSGESSMSVKLVVLLEEGENIDTSLPESLGPGILLVRQQAIIQALANSHLSAPMISGRVFRAMLPIDMMQPYEVGSSYSPSVFVGRAKERESILARVDCNYAVYGGRKIGKTWFLKDVCHLCEREPYSSIYTPFYVSLQSVENVEDAASAILMDIHHHLRLAESQAQDPLTRLRNTLLRVHRITGKTVLLSLDEVDSVLGVDRHHRLFGKLRQLQETYPQAFKFVFAGFKELIHAFSDESSNNPFVNWIGRNHGSLRCLSEDELWSLVVDPLRWVGLDFNAEEIVAKVFDLTSGHPYYAQSLCHSIVDRRLRHNANVLLPRNIDKIATEEFFHDIFDIFTLNLSPLQRLIGKIYADSEAAFSDSDVVALLKSRFDIDMSEQRIREEMKILQACSVFIRSAHGYRPLMQRINQEFFKHQDDVELALDYLEGLDGA